MHGNDATAEVHSAVVHNAGHRTATGHDQHEAHAGHGVDHTGHELMFRNRFWGCLLLTLPVLLYSHILQIWFGFTLPSFPGSPWIGPLFAGIIFLYGGVPFLQIFYDVMDIVPNKGWQVVKEKNGLRILLVDPQTDLQSVRRQVSEVLRAKGAEVLEITIETVNAIPKAKSGKSPLIKAYKNAP